MRGWKKQQKVRKSFFLGGGSVWNNLDGYLNYFYIKITNQTEIPFFLFHCINCVFSFSMQLLNTMDFFLLNMCNFFFHIVYYVCRLCVNHLNNSWAVRSSTTLTSFLIVLSNVEGLNTANHDTAFSNRTILKSYNTLLMRKVRRNRM